MLNEKLQNQDDKSSKEVNSHRGGVTVVSLFDGISCGMVALERAGIPVKKYYAYEIDEAAITISRNNHPDIIQCGDVFDADFTEYSNVDLLIGGSPCTFWSSAKCPQAKEKKEVTPEGQGWELFLKCVQAKETINPTYFLYENNYGIAPVIINTISEKLGVEPIMIDSSLVSAQRRKRLYWTNIPNIAQPENRGIVLRDVAVFGEQYERTFDDRIRKTIKSTKYGFKYDLGGKGHYPQQDRLYLLDGKAPTVPKSRTETKINIYLGDERYKITCPVECERLQTLPDNYTNYVPKTRRFEAIGNGWTVEVIAHIFRGLKKNGTNVDSVKTHCDGYIDRPNVGITY